MARDDTVRFVRGQTSLSSSQEISLLKEGRRLHNIITAMGFEPPLRLFAFDCTHNLWSLALAILGYRVHAVEKDPEIARWLEQQLKTSKLPLSYSSLQLFELNTHPASDFDVAVINGAVLSELRTDVQLQQACEQISSKIGVDGLLLMTGADHDDILSKKERTWKPQIAEDGEGRHIQLRVRDWRGNGYEFIETCYVIDDCDTQPTITRRASQRRAWRRVEITLALQNTGFVNVDWHTYSRDQHIVVARKQRINNP